MPQVECTITEQELCQLILVVGELPARTHQTVYSKLVNAFKELDQLPDDSMIMKVLR